MSPEQNWPRGNRELRFLADRLCVFAPDGVDALAEFRYTAVETVEVDGPGRVDRWPTGEQTLITAAFGLTGALVAFSGMRMKAFARMQTADGELFFLHTTLLPEDLRILLSRGISAIRETRASLANAGDAGSLVDELARLWPDFSTRACSPETNSIR